MSLLSGGRRLGGLGLGAARVVVKADANEDNSDDGSEEEQQHRIIHKPSMMELNVDDKSDSIGRDNTEMPSSLLDILNGSTQNPLPQPGQLQGQQEQYQQQQKSPAAPHACDMILCDTSKDDWTAVFDSPTVPNISTYTRGKRKSSSGSSVRRSSLLLGIDGSSRGAQRVLSSPELVHEGDINTTCPAASTTPKLEFSSRSRSSSNTSSGNKSDCARRVRRSVGSANKNVFAATPVDCTIVSNENMLNYNEMNDSMGSAAVVTEIIPSSESVQVSEHIYKEKQLNIPMILEMEMETENLVVEEIADIVGLTT